MDIFLLIFTITSNPHSAGEKAQGMPYEVQVTVPVENYDPVQFTLVKKCGTSYWTIICKM